MKICIEHQHRHSTAGFTLIELIVTLFILGVLASAAFPLTQLAFKRHKEEQLRHSLATIRDALDAYKRACTEGHIAVGPLDSGYPPNLAVLVKGVVDATSPAATKMYFLRRVPADPMSADDGDSAEGSWGKRSYESDADSPREGVDVYDIYSQSSDVGLNGIPYREW